MIPRRYFTRLPVAAAVSAAVAAAADDVRPVRHVRGGPHQIEGSWQTLMTFNGTPPAPLPKSFFVLETFLSEGECISSPALPFTTTAHGSWDNADDGKFKTRTLLIVLPQVLGVAVIVEIKESITLDSSREKYTGTFEATFTPETGSAFTLMGVPTGSRIPAP